MSTGPAPACTQRPAPSSPLPGPAPPLPAAPAPTCGARPFVPAAHHPGSGSARARARRGGAQRGARPAGRVGARIATAARAHWPRRRPAPPPRPQRSGAAARPGCLRRGRAPTPSPARLRPEAAAAPPGARRPAPASRGLSWRSRGTAGTTSQPAATSTPPAAAESHPQLLLVPAQLPQFALLAAGGQSPSQPLATLGQGLSSSACLCRSQGRCSQFHRDFKRKKYQCVA